jgi:hypothetical protein
MPQQQMPSRHDSASSAATSAARTPLLFLALVTVVSIPFYFLERRALLPEGMPFIAVTSLMVFVPSLLALTFTFKESGWRGVRALLARAVDIHKIRPVVWLLPALFLLPVALYLAYHVSRLLGNDLGPATPLWMDAGRILVFFVLLLIPFAIAEELGWMGYAADPLQERWGTLAERGGSILPGGLNCLAAGRGCQELAPPGSDLLSVYLCDLCGESPFYSPQRAQRGQKKSRH